MDQKKAKNFLQSIVEGSIKAIAGHFVSVYLIPIAAPQGTVVIGYFLGME